MLGQLDGLSIELSRNKGHKSVKNFSDFPDARGREVTQRRFSVNLRPTLTYADANTVS